jgi:transposase
MQEQCVGVDVSKQHLDWVLGGEGSVSRVNNTPAGVRSLTAKLRRRDMGLIVVESTGGYERALVEALAKASLPVVLVNPWRVRRFSEGMGVLAKTDPVDARILALFGERARPPRRPLPGPTQRQLADLIRRRRQLIAMVTAEKNRLDTATAVIKRDINALVKILERRVAKIDERIDTAIASDPEKAENWERLQTTPSVGPGVARALIIDLPELGSLGRKQIASLVGLAPFAKDSGRKAGHRRIRAGRSAPRTALYLAAMNAARFNPTLKPVYDRMIAAGKPPKVAFIALARKLLTILNAMVRDGTTWQQATR